MNGGIDLSGYYDRYNTSANTISISEGGNSCGYVQYNNVPFWSSGHCYTLQNIKEGYHNLFLYHYLKAREKEIMALRIGSGLPNIQKKDLEKFSAGDDYTDGIAETLRSIESTEVSFVLKEVDKKVTKVSMRSKNIDVAKICEIFGGGGHTFAAGCTIKANMKDSVSKLLKEIEL